MSGYEGDLSALETWELLENHPDAALVDVRTPQEWAETGVPDLSTLHRRVVLATLVGGPGGAPELLSLLSDAGLTPGSGRPVVFICRGGGRSSTSAQIATVAGITPAYNVLDGVEGPHGWVASMLPVVDWDGSFDSPPVPQAAGGADTEQGSQVRPDEDEAGA